MAEPDSGHYDELDKPLPYATVFVPAAIFNRKRV